MRKRLIILNMNIRYWICKEIEQRLTGQNWRVRNFFWGEDSLFWNPK
jgi:hypothetical protein